jgi:hypothetical protein
LAAFLKQPRAAAIPNNFYYIITNLFYTFLKSGMCVDSVFEYEKIQKHNNQNKAFIPENFEKMCMLLGLEIRTYNNIDCKYDNKIVI